MKNRYGVDITYFYRWFERSLKVLGDYKPDELARELARMSRAADSAVVLEPEFAKALIDRNKNEFINGVAATLGYILNNGEAIPEEELQRIGGIVLEARGIDEEYAAESFADSGHEVAYQLLDAMGKKAGITPGNVTELIEWIDKLPDPD